MPFDGFCMPHSVIAEKYDYFINILIIKSEFLFILKYNSPLFFIENLLSFIFTAKDI
jgi:hypothetical protein